MKAMVFAAGYGQRLRPMTETLPKAMIPLRGRPMIEYSLRLLGHSGITEVIINLHHLGSKIEEALGNGATLGLKIDYLREEELLDTGGGLFKAKELLREGTFLVINSDVLIDLPLKELIACHQRNKATATLVLRADEMAEQFGVIETSSDGRIRRFLGQAAPGPIPNSLDRLMFTGVQVLEPKIFEFMEGEKPFSLTRVTYPKMLFQGEPLHGLKYKGYWQDLGTPERLREAEEKLARGEVKLHYLE